MSEDNSTKDTEKTDEDSASIDAVESKPVVRQVDSKPVTKSETSATVQKTPNVTVVVTPGADADTVYLSRCVFKNQFARKSLTVHHLQRRLYELGYRDAYSDKDGWYGDLTAKSVKEFQEAKGLEATGVVDAATFEAVFAGDRAVVVNTVD